MWRSLPQMPLCTTLTRTSPTPGVGSSTVSRRMSSRPCSRLASIGSPPVSRLLLGEEVGRLLVEQKVEHDDPEHERHHADEALLALVADHGAQSTGDLERDPDGEQDAHDAAP